MLNDRLELLKNQPCPENVYYFFLYTSVSELPKNDLSYFFDIVNASTKWFQIHKDSDNQSKKAEKKLKEIILELYVRMEKEHIPEVCEPFKLMIHDKPDWTGLNEIWEFFK